MLIHLALLTALALTLAIRDGLAGPTAWAPVALFTHEVLLAVAALLALRYVTTAELESALSRNRALARADAQPGDR